MAETGPCPFRFVYKGRTFCAVAIRDRRYTTTEVVPTACSGCRARVILEEVNCANLSLGVEVDIYGGSHDVNVFYASCEKLVERLSGFGKCSEENCPHWQPIDGEAIERQKADALAAIRKREAAMDD